MAAVDQVIRRAENAAREYDLTVRETMDWEVEWAVEGERRARGLVTRRAGALARARHERDKARRQMRLMTAVGYLAEEAHTLAAVEAASKMLDDHEEAMAEIEAERRNEEALAGGEL